MNHSNKSLLTSSSFSTSKNYADYLLSDCLLKIVEVNFLNLLNAVGV